jgi:hypothetical protein
VLVHRLLARQQALFGALTLPPPCKEAGGPCVALADPGKFAGRIIARGCEKQIWAVESNANRGTIGNGGWGGQRDERQLIRLPAGATPWVPKGSPIYVDDTKAEGNVFDDYQIRQDVEEPRTEADLIENACVASGGNAGPGVGHA